MQPIVDELLRNDARVPSLEHELAPEIFVFRWAGRLVIPAECKHGLSPVRGRRVTHPYAHDQGMEDEVDVVGERLPECTDTTAALVDEGHPRADKPYAWICVEYLELPLESSWPGEVVGVSASDNLTARFSQADVQRRNLSEVA